MRSYADALEALLSLVVLQGCLLTVFSVMACPLQIVVLFALMLHADLLIMHNLYCDHTLRLDKRAFTHKVVVLFTLFLYAILVLVPALSRVHPMFEKE